MEKESIILLGHGSRRKEANEILRSVTEIIKSKIAGINIECAYLEHAEPGIRGTIEKFAVAGFDSILVIPYFLYSGNHVSRDIPEIIDEYREKYPEINFKLGGHLGIDERIAELVTERIASLKSA
jgi:sirohydrochlorin cobaltochelatase